MTIYVVNWNYIPYIDTIEFNVEETEVLRISRQPSAVQIMIDQKQPEIVEYCNNRCNMITSDARCTHEIKSSIAMAKAAF